MSEPGPRIVRLLPTRSSRSPQAVSATENTAAALLLVFTVAAILWANSPWADSYSTFWSTPIGLSFGDVHAELTVKEIVNDGLMTFFFFIVGLEVTSELTIGELTDRARAAVPLVAAIAGMALPALIFLLFNPSGEERTGLGRGDLHRHRVRGGGTRDHRAEISRPPTHLPSHVGDRRRRRSAGRDRAVLLRKHPHRAADGCPGVDRRDRVGAAAAGVPRARLRGAGIRAVVGAVHGRCASDPGGCGHRAADPGLHSRTTAGGTDRGVGPGLPAVAQLAVRPRRDPRSARIDFDQRAAPDRRRAVRVFSRAADLRAGQCRRAARRGDAVRRGPLAADVGHRRGPGGGKADRHHRRDRAHARHRDRASWRPG